MENEVRVKRELDSMVLPRLPVFSGDEKDCPYDVWEFEVKCLLQEERSQHDIRLAIRRSLKGQAARTLMSLGTEASVKDILTKFEAVFGETLTAQTVLSQFYSLRQKTGEDAGAFALRLENTIQKAVALNRVTMSEKDALLKEAFEGGLLRTTRAATSYLFTTDISFDKLQVEVKRKEKELGLLPPASAACAQEDPIKKISAQLNAMQTEIQSLKRQVTQPRREERQDSHPQPKNNWENYQQRRGLLTRHRTLTCWRCGQEGHVKSGCRQPSQPLNGSTSAGGGQPQTPQFNRASWGNRH